MATLRVRQVGDYIRDQRHTAQISLRQLARLAGVSNPYLSQIERGLRKPSAEILQQIARALRISAEALYVQAGILEDREGQGDLPGAILGDPTLTERQKQVLLEIVDSFRKENDVVAGGLAPSVSEAATTSTARPVRTPTSADGADAPPARQSAKSTGSTSRRAAAKSGATSAAKSAAKPATKRQTSTPGSPTP